MTKLAMRRLWFQVHKWIGLLLVVLIIPISLSGAALVWDDGLDRLINPARYATSGDALIAPQTYADAARRALPPGTPIAQIAFPVERGPVIVTASSTTSPGRAAARPTAGPPPRTMLYLDPPTARVLAIADTRSGLIRTLHRLHGSLLVPGVGRQLVGWIGAAMAMSCLTGLWLWWPAVGRWTRGLRWHRHRDTEGKLHYRFGFWIALPLFVASLTGAWISFPAFFGALSGEASRGRGPDRGAMMRATPLARPALTLAQVIGAARAAAAGPGGGGGDVRAIAWPTDRSADWTVAFDRGITIAVADDSGTAALAPARGPGGPGGIAGLMRRLHDGTGMGWAWQGLLVLTGLVPALLGVTGVILWWRGRGWKAALAAKRSAARS